MSLRPEKEPEFKKTPPDSLEEFRNVEGTPIIPQISEKRKCTDIFCLPVAVIVNIVFIAVVICCWVGHKGFAFDPDTFAIMDRDDCGNYCGIENTKRDVYPGCVPMNYRRKSMMYMYTAGNKTVRECKSYEDCVDMKAKIAYYFCTTDAEPKGEVDEVYLLSKFLEAFSKTPVVMLFVSIFTILLMILFFYAMYKNTKVTFYCLIAIAVVWVAFITILGWIAGILVSAPAFYFIIPVFFTIILAIFFLFLYCCRKRIPLVITIYEETLKMIFKSPVLLAHPILSLLPIVIQFGLVYATAASVVAQENLKQEPDEAILMGVSILFTFILIWTHTFVVGSQTIIVAGTIAFHYFEKDNMDVRNPWLKSFRIYVRFHLGTVVLGSLIITIMQMIEKIIHAASEDGNYWLYCILQMICACFREIVEYITKKAYIMTAMHGKPFFKSGIRAARLMWHNLLDLIAVDVIGAYLMSVVYVLLFFLVIILGYGITVALSIKMPFLILTLFIAMIGVPVITYLYIAVMNVATETVFLCFCEDKAVNDGSVKKPYSMPPKLRALVEDELEKRQQ